MGCVFLPSSQLGCVFFGIASERVAVVRWSPQNGGSRLTWLAMSLRPDPGREVTGEPSEVVESGRDKLGVCDDARDRTARVLTPDNSFNTRRAVVNFKFATVILGCNTLLYFLSSPRETVDECSNFAPAQNRISRRYLWFVDREKSVKSWKRQRWLPTPNPQRTICNETQ